MLAESAVLVDRLRYSGRCTNCADPRIRCTSLGWVTSEGKPANAGRRRRWARACTQALLPSLAVRSAAGARVRPGANGRRPGDLVTVVGAIVFAVFHLSGPTGTLFKSSRSPFDPSGVAFSASYLVRGFGITAWTYAPYDVFLCALLEIFVQSVRMICVVNCCAGSVPNKVGHVTLRSGPWPPPGLCSHSSACLRLETGAIDLLVNPDEEDS